MKTKAETEIQTQTERLLEDLIAECHAIIRDEIIPVVRTANDMEKRSFLSFIPQMMDSAVKLGDAVGRLRGTAPQPELRQRITVERIQRLSPAPGEGGGARS